MADGGAPRRKQDIAGRLEEDIHLGHLGPGAWLKQVDLEARYGCTRIDLRQALDLLATRGLVRLEANRGYRVAEFEPRRLAEILQLRALVEGEAMGQLIGRIPPAALDALEPLAGAFAAAVAQGTLAQQEAANRAFHLALLAHCPNREAVSLVFDLRGRIPLAVTRRKNTQLTLERTAREHFEMISCLRRGDAAGLAAVIRVHILGERDEALRPLLEE